MGGSRIRPSLCKVVNMGSFDKGKSNGKARRIPIRRVDRNKSLESVEEREVEQVEDTQPEDGQGVERPSSEQEIAQKAEADGWHEKYLRLYADLENVKKRAERAAESRFEREKTHLLRDMLTLADNLERALASSGDDESDGLREGIELTLKAFRSVMAKHGVDLIDARGQAFDPDVHEAVGFAPDADLAPGMVAQVQEAGYTLDGKLLRPARVLVTPER